MKPASAEAETRPSGRVQHQTLAEAQPSESAALGAGIKTGAPGRQICRKRFGKDKRKDRRRRLQSVKENLKAVKQESAASYRGKRSVCCHHASGTLALQSRDCVRLAVNRISTVDAYSASFDIISPVRKTDSPGQFYFYQEIFYAVQ